ncbi:MAG: hypothetical protein BWY65_01132 [Firmicutes bacterium ADurb.Bin373]|nr:MAG: hypothetical protein BWY65_01132 [Firmicutes bacterium ADurb.Bin373]
MLVLVNSIENFRGQPFLLHLLDIPSNVVKTGIPFMPALQSRQGHSPATGKTVVVIKYEPVAVLNVG